MNPSSVKPAIALLAPAAALFWVLLLVGSNPFDPANPVVEQSYDLLLTAKIEDVARHLQGAAPGEQGGPGGQGSPGAEGLPGGARPLATEHAAAVAALLEDLRSLSGPDGEAAPDPLRETRLRAATLLALAGELESAAEQAARADAAPLARALRTAAAAPERGGPLGPAEVEEAAAAGPPGRWQRARLSLLLAEAAGTPEAWTESVARYQDAVDRLAGLGALLGGVLLLAGVGGLGLIAAAPWRLRRWLRSRPAGAAAPEPGAAAPGRFPGGAPVAAVTLLAWFLAHVAAGAALALFLPGTGPQQQALPLAVFLAALSLVTGLVGLALVQWLARPEAPLLAALGFTVRPNGRAVRWALGGVAAAVPLVIGASLLNRVLVGPQGLPPALVLLSADPEPLAFALLVVATVGLAPVFEEAVFRGYLYPALRSRWGVALAAAVSGGAFALVHVQLGNLLPLWTLGVVFALVREATGTLWAPALSHALWNLGSLAMAGFVFG